MESTHKHLYLILFLVLIGTIHFGNVNGAGECGKIPPDRMALKLAPCGPAARDVRAPVSSQCCTQVQTIGRNPKCLCSVLLSNTARSAGIKPEIAITIPKRCNIKRRPIGYKCGAYTLP
ncbi:hypothetical protein LUZ60_010862 [Juncus effusus]|nr:hypothetical protein LUZ60_010862 [Juncus effusus]